AWERDVVVSPKAAPGRRLVELGIMKLLVCEKNNCLPPQKVPLKAEFTIADAPAQVVEEKYRTEVEGLLGGALPPPDPPSAVAVRKRSTAKPQQVPTPPPNGRPVAPPAATLSDHVANLEKIKEQLPKHTEERKTLLNFILTAVFWGLVSLV